MKLPSIDRWGSLTGKRVLVRVDFNVPVDTVNGVLTVVDDFRIRAAVPLFHELMSRGAQVVACTHFGRPKSAEDVEFSVAPLRRRLEELCPDVELLENLRFNPGEVANDFEFGRALIEGFDYYVNEAFGVSHRKHASIMVPPQLVPSAAGPNLDHEVAVLLGVLHDPVRPFVAIFGGAKVADKIDLIKVMAEKADTVVVGGGMAYTFWCAEGRTIGTSLCDESRIDICRELMRTGKVLISHDVQALPSDAPFGAKGGNETPTICEENIPDGWQALDIGPRTVAAFQDVIDSAKTILWNGPMGVFEDSRFSGGTEAIAREVAASAATSIVGGGDSASAIKKFGLQNEVSYVSTGGGASMELVERGDLCGLRALRESPWTPS